ncbi:hypothetical protein FA15DRAFT_675319 [Coprinopsis marcescibilis]|uniref:THUMP domain-containing protein n=1 Tax=Coprinopsis marcescibilis TaxID=230819 RepID=A0A5C3KE48_COPMA|nr:hypothetical protein FA15DRAFT_675319 [Coprinopsis marcescibilis]
MAENSLKRKPDNNNHERAQKKKRLEGGSRRFIDGPGVWITCVKGKERQTVGEIYDLFDSVASEIWPVEGEDEDGAAGSDGEELSLEAQIAKEVSEIKKPRSEQRFANCLTDTQCVVFMSCKPPVDPVELVMKYIQNIQETGVTRTRHTQRLVPVSDTCTATIPDIKALCLKLFEKFFSKEKDTKFKYKIELRIRNHTTLTRPIVIQHIASWVPEGHTVSLDNPDIFILVEIFKSICGVSIVRDYYKLSKFNVLEVANATRKQQSESVAE